MGQIRFENVKKSFGHVTVIEDLNLTIEDGKFTVLVGASGCGKTTLLRMIAGIGPATSGHIYLNEKEITDLAPGKRDIAMVFQNYAIYPTMTVKENIEFGLKNNRIPKEERNRRIDEVTTTLGLYEYLDRKPSTLSGGQRQRVALARAMVKEPQVFLMDEPLSNLDAKLRAAMRTELIEMHNRLKTTFVYVTHDQVEAMAMADTIVLMDKGKIIQEASPAELYNDPNNVFAAQFIGTPPMNILKLKNGYHVGFRPEKIEITKQKNDDFFSKKGTIITREMLGSETLYKIELEDENIFVMAKSIDDNFDFYEEVYVCVEKKNLFLFDNEGERIRREHSAIYDESLNSLEGQKNE